MTFVAGVISRLKQRNNVVVDFYRTQTLSPNLETGREVRTKTTIRVPKVIVMPPQMAFQMSQAVVPLSGAGMNHGGFIQSEGTTLLVDGKDIPASFHLDNENCYAVIKGVRYEIIKVQEYLLREAFVVNVKAVALNPEQIISRNINDELSLTEVYSVE